MFTKVAVLGSGLLGEAFFRLSPYPVTLIDRRRIDLTDKSSLTKFFLVNKFDLVINASGVVGGISLNTSRNFYMFSENLKLNLSILESCISASVPQLVNFSSNCAYPIDASQPLRESSFFSGQPSSSNLGFAAAKTAIAHGCQAAFLESGLHVLQPIPCSLYGCNDNYSLNNSHFVAAAIRKLSFAVKNSEDTVTFWGSGSPFREIMFADEIVNAVYFLLANNVTNQLVNIGSGTHYSLKSIANTIKTIIGFSGQICWDSSFPDGVHSKLLDSSFLADLGWHVSSSLESGLRSTIKEFPYSSRLL